MPRFPSSQPYKYLKAEKSIEPYNINHSDFVRVRIDLRDQIERLKADARKFYSKLETGDAVHEAAYASAISQLSRLRSEQAPFSAFCSTMIDRARHEDYMYGLYNT